MGDAVSSMPMTAAYGLKIPRNANPVPPRRRSDKPVLPSVTASKPDNRASVLASRVTKSGVGPLPGRGVIRPRCYATLLFLLNASRTSLGTLLTQSGSSGRGSRSYPGSSDLGSMSSSRPAACRSGRSTPPPQPDQQAERGKRLDRPRAPLDLAAHPLLHVVGAHPRRMLAREVEVGQGRGPRVVSAFGRLDLPGRGNRKQHVAYGRGERGVGARPAAHDVVGEGAALHEPGYPERHRAGAGVEPALPVAVARLCFVNLSFHKTASVRFTRQREDSSRTSVALAPILSSPTTPRA